MEETRKNEKTLWQKLTYVYKNITVEPMLGTFILAGVVASLACQNLNLEKACRVSLNYTDEICDALSRREIENYTKQEKKTQEVVAAMSIWKSFLQSIIPAALVLFLGAYSDKIRRRKPLMMLPLTGEFITSIGLIVCTYWMYELSLEFGGFVQGFFPATFGGWTTMYIAVFSYIGDITSVEDRTFRIGLANICSSVSSLVAMALSGILFQLMGFYGVFFLSTFIYIISFLCCYFGIHDKKDKTTNTTQNITKNNRKFNLCRTVTEVFDFRSAVDTVIIVFKSGDNNRKKKIILLMVAIMMILGPGHGESTVLYLFMRYKFKWEEVKFSVFITYSSIVNTIGTTISISVFSHFLKMDDALLGVMACISKILASLVYLFSTAEWTTYLAPVADVVSGTSVIAVRSIISKLVPSDELGKINSVLGLAEAIVPCFYGPIYNAIYMYSIGNLDSEVYRGTLSENFSVGAFFLVGSFLTAPALGIFVWLYLEQRNSVKNQINSTATSDNQSDGTIIRGDDPDLQMLNKNLK